MNNEPFDKFKLDVSVEEVLILLNTFLTIWGVPFVSTAKPVLPMPEEAIDRLTDSLRKARDPIYEEFRDVPGDECWEYMRHQVVSVLLGQAELSCIEVALQAVLNETADAPGQLCALIAPREEVAALLNRVTTALHPIKE